MKKGFIDTGVLDYLSHLSEHPEKAVLDDLRRETAQLFREGLLITPEQGQFLEFFNRIQGTCRSLEIGTFTGYSASFIAMALPEDGELICLEKRPVALELAYKYWDVLGIRSKISVRLAEAEVSLRELLVSDSQSFDFVFIDADKNNYSMYYEYGLKLLKPKGFMILDNMLWRGEVLEPQTDYAQSIHQLNQRIFMDSRVHCYLLPLGDGMLLAQRIN